MSPPRRTIRGHNDNKSSEYRDEGYRHNVRRSSLERKPQPVREGRYAHDKKMESAQFSQKPRENQFSSGNRGDGFKEREFGFKVSLVFS